jgi:hypothetical protein
VYQKLHPAQMSVLPGENSLIPVENFLIDKK